MLNDFILEDGNLTNGQAGQDIVGFCRDKVKVYREAGHKIVYVCDNHEEDDSEFHMFPKHCVANTDGAKIIDELEPELGDKIIFKRRYSSFFGTELDLYLRENKIDEISLIGVCTNICVLYTTADARNLAYDVNVYTKGVATFDQDAHEAALKEMGTTLGARLID